MRQSVSKRVAELEYQLSVAKHGAEVSARCNVIKARLQSAAKPVQVSHTPIHFVRPEKYMVPTLGAWKRWIESRVGVFMLHGILHQLCISCGFPIPSSSGTRQTIGDRNKKTIQASHLTKVTVGAVVKWTEIEEETWNVYNPLVADVVELTERKVFRVVSHRALGCPECQMHYLKVKAECIRSYRDACTRFTQKAMELDRAITEYRKTCSDPNPQLLQAMQHIESPKEPTPFILIDARSIEMEKTVAYWKQAQGRE